MDMNGTRKSYVFENEPADELPVKQGNIADEPSPVKESFPTKSPRDSLPPQDSLPPPKNILLQVGVVFVIGAVAANVFGFRQSRWAVGKDLHRAWERSNAHRNAKQAQQAQRAGSRRSTVGSGGDRSAFRRTQVRSPDHIFEEFVRQAETYARDSASQQEHSQRSSRNTRSNGSGADRSTASEDARSRGKGNRGHSWQQSTSSTRYEGNFDPASIEELLRRLQQGRPRANPSFRSSSMFDSFRELEDLIRTAQEAQAKGQVHGSHQREGDFDAEFWNAVFGADTKARQRGHSRSRASSQQSSHTTRNGSLRTAFHKLGLSEGATKDEVKAAYRRQAIKYHPDTYQGADPEYAARNFRDVTAAYHLVKDIS